MLLLAANLDEASATSNPIGFIVFAVLLLAIGGLVALGIRQRRTVEQQLDLEWLPLDE